MLNNEIIITGSRAITRSFAKINLTLDVLNKLDNGYHNVEMIMQSISLFDLIIIDKAPSGISITTNLKYLPVTEKNIAYQAAKIFFEYTHINGGVKMLIHKNIPVAAGLAGGSGNAAAVLCALNKLYNTNLPLEILCKIGASLGADVPYCICGGTMLATGIGEILTPISSMPRSVVLIVKPPISVSTATIYEHIDKAEPSIRPDTNAMINALKQKNIYDIASNLCNVMEAVTENMYPVIRGIKNKMLNNGAIGTVMSGSGPSVFGIFDDELKAKQSHDSFAYQYKDVFLVRTI